jgi:hypothetical protein
MIDTDVLPMPLGVRTALVEVELSEFDIEELKLSVPDRYYVLNFERAHSYGPIRMDSNDDGSNYYVGWSSYASRIRLDRDNFLLAQIAQQINWELVVCPMFAATGIIFYGRRICRHLECFEETFYGATIAYLALNDPSALVELGAQPGLVNSLRASIPRLEQDYISSMAEEYKNRLIREETASDWDKMWMAYFGFEFYVPPPPPPPPKSLAEQINENRDVIYKEPLVRMGSGVGVKGHFAYVSYVDSPNESVFKSSRPNIYITNVFYGVKSISDVAFWRITGVWRFLENQNEVIIDGWRWNGVYLWQSRHLQLIHDAVVRLKGMWVYCDEAFYKLFNYFKDQSTSVQYRVFSGFYGSDIQSLRMRTYLDQHKRMVVTNHKRFAFVDVSTFTLSGSTPGVLFGDLRLLKLSANDVFDGFNSEPLNLPG